MKCENICVCIIWHRMAWHCMICGTRGSMEINAILVSWPKHVCKVLKYVPRVYKITHLSASVLGLVRLVMVRTNTAMEAILTAPAQSTCSTRARANLLTPRFRYWRVAIFPLSFRGSTTSTLRPIGGIVISTSLPPPFSSLWDG